MNSRTITLFLTVLISLTVAACSPSLTLTYEGAKGGKADYSVSVSKTGETLIRRFTANPQAADTAQDANPGLSPLFDRQKITTSLQKAGISPRSILFPTPASLLLSLEIPAFEGILENALKTETASGELVVSLTKESVNAAVTLMPEDTILYLDLLMAPVFSGESLDEEEYVQLVSSMYGKKIADELAESRFTLTITGNSPVKNATLTGQGQVKTDNGKAVFSIPLTALLVMAEPITGRVSFR